MRVHLRICRLFSFTSSLQLRTVVGGALVTEIEDLFAEAALLLDIWRQYRQDTADQGILAAHHATSRQMTSLQSSGAGGCRSPRACVTGCGRKSPCSHTASETRTALRRCEDNIAPCMQIITVNTGSTCQPRTRQWSNMLLQARSVCSLIDCCG